MVPFADFINHHNVDSSYELVSKDSNPNQTEVQLQSFPKAYYTQSKKEIDYSDLFEHPTTQDEE
jgi:hypothetical protein